MRRDGWPSTGLSDEAVESWFPGLFYEVTVDCVKIADVALVDDVIDTVGNDADAKIYSTRPLEIVPICLPHDCVDENETVFYYCCHCLVYGLSGLLTRCATSWNDDYGYEECDDN